VPNNARHRYREISEFIPKPAPPPCQLCQFFPVVVQSDYMVRRLNRRIAKEQPGPQRQKLERLRDTLSGSGSITTYLPGERKDFTFSILMVMVPGVTAGNWDLVRDYIFYGPPTTPAASGLLLLFHCGSLLLP
jgi:hypothetical protein